MFRQRGPGAGSRIATGKTLGEVLSFCSSDSHVGEATNRAEHTTTVNAVADRQSPSVLERVAKPGKEADVSESSFPLLDRPSPDRRLRLAVRVPDPEYLAGLVVIDLCLGIGTWLVACWKARSDLVPPDATKYDHMAGQVVRGDAGRAMEDVETWISARKCP